MITALEPLASLLDISRELGRWLILASPMYSPALASTGDPLRGNRTVRWCGLMPFSCFLMQQSASSSRVRRDRRADHERMATFVVFVDTYFLARASKHLPSLRYI